MNEHPTGPRIDVIGCFADPAPGEVERLSHYGVAYLGPVSALDQEDPGVSYVIGIGDPTTRGEIDRRLAATRRSLSLVHPSAQLGVRVELGEGTIVAANSTVMNHTTTGRHVHVSIGCAIGHDVTLGSYTTVSPGVSMAGYVTAGDGAFLGVGATVLPKVSLGPGSVIGAGAVVTRTVDAEQTVAGVPARPLPTHD